MQGNNKKARVLYLSFLMLLGPLTSAAQSESDFGVLVMAHGGGEEWDAGVLETVEPLRERYPLEVAFGMADAVSLQDAVDRLEERGVRDIAVVRLFISGESWHERTRQILGLEEGAPARPAPDPHAGHGADAHAAHAGHSMEFWRVDSAARFQVSADGLADAAEMSEVLLSRAQALSTDPAAEDVLILAHGPESDEEDARWIANMEALAAPLADMGFHSIEATTLREDWPEKREVSQQAIRDFVQASADAGRRAIVIPFRVHGFGPYAEVLEGLDYAANEVGLIPHPAVASWIERQAEALRVEFTD